MKGIRKMQIVNNVINVTKEDADAIVRLRSIVSSCCGYYRDCACCPFDDNFCNLFAGGSSVKKDDLVGEYHVPKEIIEGDANNE